MMHRSWRGVKLASQKRQLSLGAHHHDLHSQLIARRVVPFQSEVLQSWCNADPKAGQCYVVFISFVRIVMHCLQDFNFVIENMIFSAACMCTIAHQM
jgi:hypothetical protein